MDFAGLFKIVLDIFFSKKSIHQLSTDELSVLIAFVFVAIGTLLTSLFKLSKWLYEKNRQHKLEKDLHPYYTENDVVQYTKYFITTKGQNIPPHREKEPGDTHAFATRENLIDKFIKDEINSKTNNNRFYIVLADSGMGKTAFMINLYLKYISKFIFSRKFNIILLPLAYPGVLDRLSELENKRNTLLLLDALDEDQEAVVNYKKQIERIIDITKDFRKIIITCRTQFFPNDLEESIETGIMKFGPEKGQHIFMKIYISPFDNEDVKSFLNKKYGKFNIFKYKDKKKAKEIVRRSPNLVVRPMLLSYIDDLLKSEKSFEYTYQIYEELIQKWLDREVRNLPLKEVDNHKKQLYAFSQDISKHIYKEQIENNKLFISREKVKLFAEENNILLEHWQLTGRSLLNRDVEGNFKFSHKSILEYFLFKHITQDLSFSVNFLGFDTSKYFLEEFIQSVLRIQEGFFFNEVEATMLSPIYTSSTIHYNIKSQSRNKDIIYNIFENIYSKRDVVINEEFYIYYFIKEIIKTLDQDDKTGKLFDIDLLLLSTMLTSPLRDNVNFRQNFLTLPLNNHLSKTNVRFIDDIFAIYLNLKENVFNSYLSSLRLLRTLFYIKIEYEAKIDLSFLSHLKNIKTLYLHSTDRIIILDFLFSMENLNFLIIRSNERINIDIIKPLDYLKNIKILILIVPEIFDEDVRELRSKFRHTYATFLTDKDLKFINYV